MASQSHRRCRSSRRGNWPLFYLIITAYIPIWSGVDLHLSGIQAFGKNKIENSINLPEKPGKFSEDDWRDWIEETEFGILELYEALGFFEAEVQMTVPRDGMAKNKEDWDVFIHIREGARFKFSRIKITIIGASPTLVDSTDLRCQTGNPFERELIYRDRRRLELRYGNSGFVHVQVTDNILLSPSSQEVEVEFLVEPFHPVVFDTLIIRNRREGGGDSLDGMTRHGLLRDLYGLNRGDTVKLAETNSFTRKLKSAHTFNFVRLKDSLLDTSERRSAIILSGEERIPGEMDYSLFYETEYGPGVGANWTHRNLNGHFHEGKVGASIALKKQNLFLGYGTPLLFRTGIRFDNDLHVTWYQTGSLRSLGEGLFEGDFELNNSSKLSKSLSSWARVVSSAELDGKVRKIVDGSVILDTLRDLNLNYINSIFISFLDSPLEPSYGGRWAFNWGNGGPFVEKGNFQLTDYRHNWLEMESAYFLPLHSQVKLALRLDGGRFFGKGGTNSEKFFLGGPRSIRSEDWRKICPDTVSGGRCDLDVEPAYGLASFEVRLNPFHGDLVSKNAMIRPLIGLQIVPFTDYGKIWNMQDRRRLHADGFAYGLGLRYNLFSIFNLRVDYATGYLGKGPYRDKWVLDLAQAF